MITLGVQRISQLLNPLFVAHPVLPWKAVHIAGTNGKGSVAALISTFLGHLGYSVGRFTSPHLIDRWDCITINRAVVAQSKFLPVEQHFRDRSTSENIEASEFEILTATAFQLFTDEKVDVAVVECGLGGRQDATNVLRSQDVILSVLSKVGLDHVEFLGNTIESITTEKVGIFKPGVPVVVDRSNELAVHETVAKRLEALGRGKDGRGAVYSSFEERRQEFADTIERLKLGKYQAQNLYTAWSAFQSAEQSLGVIHNRSPPLPTNSVRASLEDLVVEAQASLPGRLQWLTLPSPLLPPDLSDPTTLRVLLDGAHNVPSAEGLSDFVEHNLRRKDRLSGERNHPITWLLAMKSDKDIDKILSALVKPHDNVVTCAFGPVEGMPWAEPMPAGYLAAKAKNLTAGMVKAIWDNEETEDPQANGNQEASNSNGDTQLWYDKSTVLAIQEAVRIAAREDADDMRVCITGSLYLVGDVLRCLRDAGGVYGIGQTSTQDAVGVNSAEDI